jgi:hypothetical protein
MSDKTDPVDSSSSSQPTPGLAAQSRRDLLKKGAYVTPTLLVMGTLATLNDATAQSTCNGFPCNPDGSPLPGPGG